jgi:hypothetical protein
MLAQVSSSWASRVKRDDGGPLGSAVCGLQGREPPRNRVPHRFDGTLALPLPQSVEGFPPIPAVTYNGILHTGDLWDFGPEFDDGILTILPPKSLGTPYRALVPKTDADGNDIAGIRVPDAFAAAKRMIWPLASQPSTRVAPPVSPCGVARKPQPV